ncbi:MAG: elongation factor G, partial [Pirellulales bacterium]
TSAATSVEWKDHVINLIDTPGHVDFTVEVERSLRVLDGAILVLCAVGGVQAQSLTVDRQMKRYHVPRLAFINKMDRTGANPQQVVRQVRDKLHCDAFLMQLPIGTEEDFKGVVDLVTMKALYYDGENGETVREESIPEQLTEQATEARQQMLESLSMYSDQLMELLLAEEEVPVDVIYDVLRDAVQSLDCTPVFLGTAFRNKGVQTLLDAVIRYLPSPMDRVKTAMAHDNPEEIITLKVDPKATFVGMAFKLVDDPYGQLNFMRIYQGTAEKGQQYYNQRTGAKQRFSRILRIHADKREEIDKATAGDIVAVMGVDAASGDTYAGEPKLCTLESIFVPLPVIKVAIRTSSNEAGDRLGKALARFRKEDPTFAVSTDDETGETVLAGMGELHLEIYLERIRREYNVEVVVGAPKVSYREAPSVRVDYNYRHKKQTGGSGQFAHIVGFIEPLPEDAEEEFEFEESIVGGRIPKPYIAGALKGFRAAMVKGPIAEFPVVSTKIGLTDGSFHDVDSSDMAFQTCAKNCFRETFMKTKPVLLEPVMKMEVEVPAEYQGPVAGELTSRRGIIVGTDLEGPTAVIEAHVPLAETFGYSTDLRSMTQGQGTFSMEFLCYRRVPAHVQEAVLAEKRAEKEARHLVGAK